MGGASIVSFLYWCVCVYKQGSLCVSFNLVRVCVCVLIPFLSSFIEKTLDPTRHQSYPLMFWPVLMFLSFFAITPFHWYYDGFCGFFTEKTCAAALSDSAFITSLLMRWIRFWADGTCGSVGSAYRTNNSRYRSLRVTLASPYLSNWSYTSAMLRYTLGQGRGCKRSMCKKISANWRNSSCWCTPGESLEAC